MHSKMLIGSECVHSPGGQRCQQGRHSCWTPPSFFSPVGKCSTNESHQRENRDLINLPIHVPTGAHNSIYHAYIIMCSYHLTQWDIVHAELYSMYLNVVYELQEPQVPHSNEGLCTTNSV